MQKFTIIVLALIVLGSIMIKSQVEAVSQNIINGVVPWVKQVGDNVKDISGNVAKEYDWSPRLTVKEDLDKVVSTSKVTDKDDYSLRLPDEPRQNTQVIQRERIIEREKAAVAQAEAVKKGGKCSCTCDE